MIPLWSTMPPMGTPAAYTRQTGAIHYKLISVHYCCPIRGDVGASIWLLHCLPGSWQYCNVAVSENLYLEIPINYTLFLFNLCIFIYLVIMVQELHYLWKCSLLNVCYKSGVLGPTGLINWTSLMHVYKWYRYLKAKKRHLNPLKSGIRLQTV